MIADDVRRGFSQSPKTLPPYLFYDACGSELYERITKLPEYYLTRVERSILELYADDVVSKASGFGNRPLTIVELGAGSAMKTELILRAAIRRHGSCLYIPADISSTALDDTARRLDGAIPGLTVGPIHGTHEHAFEAIRELLPPMLVMFVGSSIGNFADEEASLLLRGLSESLDHRSSLLIGTDLRKSAAQLIPAYDDSQGVTAAFNKNVLARINRELGGRFDLTRFRHEARWNDGASRIEMHLVSIEEQDVDIEALSMRVHFRVGESIHTESSIKYDETRVYRLLTENGFELPNSYFDQEKLFAVHLARASLPAKMSAVATAVRHDAPVLRPYASAVLSKA